MVEFECEGGKHRGIVFKHYCGVFCFSSEDGKHDGDIRDGCAEGNSLAVIGHTDAMDGVDKWLDERRKESNVV